MFKRIPLEISGFSTLKLGGYGRVLRTTMSRTKAFFYSSTEASWLHFVSDQGVRKFYDYSDEEWLTPDSN